jgi:proline iminopeptidase
MKNLYPELEPYNSAFLKVSDIHSIYYEESGNPEGQPVVFLHGGPGSKSKPKHRRFFNPEKYRIILFDQRGCGQSRPAGELHENTINDLVGDLEKLRNHLRVEKWMLFGGSWGSTLALTYAQTYPHNVSKMILRGIFLFRKSDIEWLYGGGGVKDVFPESWQQILFLLSHEEKKDTAVSITERVLSEDKTKSEEMIKAVNVWETTISQLVPDSTDNSSGNSDDELISSTKILFHYIKNSGFLKNNQILNEVEKLRTIPAVIIHGRYDMVCPIISAWELHSAWPEADFQVVTLAGHRSENTEIISKLVEYTDKFITI